MWIIVDGYNVIRQWPELAMLDRADLEEGREGLLRELQSYRRARGHRITVVFDGREQGGLSETTGTVAGIGVRYSRQGETADAVIARLAAEGGEGAVVVSSDREVAEAVRRRGGAWLSAAEFMARVEASRLYSLKGGEEEDKPKKPGKGVARRLPKAERQRQRRLKEL
jgi:predicted RNA-binding protein with PIN domain